MSVQTLSKVLNSTSPKHAAEITGLFSTHGQQMFSIGMSQEQLKELAAKLEQYTSDGLGLIGLVLLPDDKITDEQITEAERSLQPQDLNELLVNAKAHQWAWYEWSKDGYDRPGWMALHRASNEGWNELYSALKRSPKPIKAVLRDGQGVISIGTLGLMTSDRMITYSSTENAEYVFEGVSLQAVEKFLNEI